VIHNKPNDASSKVSKLLAHAITVFLILTVVSTDARSNEFSFNAIPSSCVALHRGQKCFADITLSWFSPDRALLCVFRNEEQDALICSSNARSEFQFRYATASSERYSLRDTSGNTLATVIVSAAWVYRTGKRSSSSWRLF